MPLIWKEHLSVGNAILDFEHKNLIGMINSIEYLINKNDIPALLKAIELLKDCAHVHFANEARFAQVFNFNFEQHDLAHQQLLKELHSTLDELESRITISDDTWSKYAMEYYPIFLRDWFVNHIKEKDMQMKTALQTHDYKFWPGRCGDEADRHNKADCSTTLATSNMGVADGDNYSSAIRKLPFLAIR